MRWRRIITLWVLAGLLGALHFAGQGRLEDVARPDEAAARAMLIGGSAADVQSMRLVRGRTEVQIVRAGTAWDVVEPPQAAIPPGLIDAFVVAITSVEVLDTVPDAADVGGRFGFDARGERIEIERVGGRHTVLEVGDVTPTGTAAYVREPRAPVRVIGRSPLDYRDLIFDAARPAGGREPGVPVAQRPLTIGGSTG